ncbi:hypothetical protein [Stakelama marina]|uniref:Uncharacterized protein n=1 Tax=Stakelama marina TaxID=2826939 RepID=A0A8T4ICW7_9SPHN|nr:hypothetical protein [Stakelama marina]MBR0552410.1 hypothetical protein [Stakelama marina]
MSASVSETAGATAKLRHEATALDATVRNSDILEKGRVSSLARLEY